MTQRSLRCLASLRTLILRTPEAEEMLVCSDPNELKALRRSYNTAEIGLKQHPKMIDLSIIFPNLEKLDLAAGKTLQSVDFCVIRNLPLTYLNCYSDLIDEYILHFLPPTMKRLSLGGRVELNISFPSLPPLLESFDWSRRWDACSPPPTEDSLSRFPPSLIKFSYDTPHESNAGLTNDHFALIEAQDVCFTQIYYLPPTMKAPPNITKAMCRWVISAPFPLLDVFPNTLTMLYLEIAALDDRQVDLSQLPASLRELWITCPGRKVKPEGLAPPLPPNLKVYVTLANQSLEGSWPLGLKELSVGGPSSSQKQPLTLPPLTSLTARHFENYDIGSLPETLASFQALAIRMTDSTVVLKFPPTLTSLRVGAMNFTPSMINGLPRTLQRLSTSKCKGEFAKSEASAADFKSLETPQKGCSIS